jgi:hypothetical protein
VHSAVGEPSSAGHGVLFGNTDIEHTLGVLGCHAVQARGPQHGSGDSNDLVVLTGDMQHLIAENPSPGHRVGGFAILSGEGINLSDRVELIGFVIESGLVTAALLSDDVDNNRSFALFGLTKRSLNILDVVAIHWTQVLDV